MTDFFDVTTHFTRFHARMDMEMIFMKDGGKHGMVAWLREQDREKDS